jgi:2-amino-4-hydroxy-6-hydroxymethyldihydropteridine diphosphokinase
MMRDKIYAYLGLGSNVGDREAHLDAAESALASAKGIYLDRISPTYESPPDGPGNQPDFLNRVLGIETWLGPRELLQTCLDVENQLGRKRSQSQGPRTVDVDILLYGEAIVDDPELQIPHPALPRRPFFLQPLWDVAGDIPLPRGGLRLSQLLAELAPYELKLYERQF